jgi:hypothetical protein
MPAQDMTIGAVTKIAHVTQKTTAALATCTLPTQFAHVTLKLTAVKETHGLKM